jgi:hypothetical protein
VLPYSLDFRSKSVACQTLPGPGQPRHMPLRAPFANDDRFNIVIFIHELIKVSCAYVGIAYVFKSTQNKLS